MWVCQHRIALGRKRTASAEQAAADVARQVKDNPDVVAAVGLGVSLRQSAEAADLLGGAPDAVPMVADVVTAEGFDATGSRGKESVFANCAASYPNGVGGGYFYRVAYGNSAQINTLASHLGAQRPDLVLTPTDLTDPYTCTALALVEKRFADQVAPVKFDPADPSTVPVAVQRICATGHPVAVFYTARSRDLGRFVRELDKAYQNGTCQPASITLLSPSDANRILAAEADPGLETIRREALASPVFQQGKLKIFYAALANANSRTGTDQYRQLAGQMAGNGFDPTDLADGWAINAYDAVSTVAQASRTLSARATVTRGQINSAVSTASVVGAGGQISFDAAGDRTGEPPILRICPPPPGKPAFTVSASTSSC